MLIDNYISDSKLYTSGPDILWNLAPLLLHPGILQALLKVVYNLINL